MSAVQGKKTEGLREGEDRLPGATAPGELRKEGMRRVVLGGFLPERAAPTLPPLRR